MTELKAAIQKVAKFQQVARRNLEAFEAILKSNKCYRFELVQLLMDSNMSQRTAHQQIKTLSDARVVTIDNSGPKDTVQITPWFAACWNLTKDLPMTALASHAGQHMLVQVDGGESHLPMNLGDINMRSVKEPAIRAQIRALEADGYLTKGGSPGAYNINEEKCRSAISAIITGAVVQQLRVADAER